MSLYMLFLFSTFGRTGVDLSIILLLFLALYGWIRRRPTESIPFWFALPFCAWLAVAVVSTLVNPDFYLNLTYLPHQFRFFLPLAMAPFLFKVDVRRLLLFYLFVIILMAIYGVFQHYFGVNFLRIGGRPLLPVEAIDKAAPLVYRAKGGYRHAWIYATIMMTMAPFFLSMFLSARGSMRYLWLGGSIMAAVGAAATISRSAPIAIFVGLLVLTLRMRPRFSIPLISVSLSAFVVLASLIGSGWIKENYPQLQHSRVIARFANSTLESAHERTYRWEAGWRAIKANPWLGVGPHKYLKFKVVPYMLKVSKERRYKFKAPTLGLIHNVHLQIGLHYGLIGMFIEWSIWGVFFFWNGIWIRRAGQLFPFETGILWGGCAAGAAAIADGVFTNNFLEGANQAGFMMFIGLCLYAGLRIRKGLASEEPTPPASPAAA